jgi:hypothetical protein
MWQVAQNMCVMAHQQAERTAKGQKRSASQISEDSDLPERIPISNVLNKRHTRTSGDTTFKPRSKSDYNFPLYGISLLTMAK